MDVCLTGDENHQLSITIPSLEAVKYRASMQSLYIPHGRF